MNRKLFLKNATILTGASILPVSSVFAQNVQNNGLDKLTDDNGNFIQSALPYNDNFLEPFMDQETTHLHYTFHHGGAVKAANNDLAMIRKSMDENNIILRVMYCTVFSGPTLPIKKQIRKGNY